MTKYEMIDTGFFQPRDTCRVDFTLWFHVSRLHAQTLLLLFSTIIGEDQLIRSRAKKPSKVGNHVLVEATLGIVGLSVIAFAIIGSVVSVIIIPWVNC